MADAVASRAWYLYIIKCADDSLYCGITTDIARRFQEHQQGAPKGAKYLRGRGPLQLVFSALVGDKNRALKLEYRVKRCTVKKKRLLISNAIQLSDL